MNYRIKVFTGEPPDMMEKTVNKWLQENDVEVVQIIPSVSISALALPVGGIAPSPGGQLLPIGFPPGGIAMQLQVQQHQMFAITIVYKKKE